MKKNLRKKATRKPEVGDFYKIYNNEPLIPNNIILICDVKDQYAYYKKMDSLDWDELLRWNFIEFPECLENKLTPLEIELL